MCFSSLAVLTGLKKLISFFPPCKLLFLLHFGVKNKTSYSETEIHFSIKQENYRTQAGTHRFPMAIRNYLMFIFMSEHNSGYNLKNGIMVTA